MEQEVQQVRRKHFKQTSFQVIIHIVIFKGSETKGATTATNKAIMQEIASREGMFYLSKFFRTTSRRRSRSNSRDEGRRDDRRGRSRSPRRRHSRSRSRSNDRRRDSRFDGRRSDDRRDRGGDRRDRPDRRDRDHRRSRSASPRRDRSGSALRRNNEKPNQSHFTTNNAETQEHNNHQSSPAVRHDWFTFAKTLTNLINLAFKYGSCNLKLTKNLKKLNEQHKRLGYNGPVKLKQSPWTTAHLKTTVTPNASHRLGKKC